MLLWMRSGLIFFFFFIILSGYDFLRTVKNSQTGLWNIIFKLCANTVHEKLSKYLIYFVDLLIGNCYKAKYKHHYTLLIKETLLIIRISSN